MLRFITDKTIYEEIIRTAVPEAQRFLWIATADIKDMYVHGGRKMIPFLEVLSELKDSGVNLRLLHAKEPGPNWRKDFDKYPNLIEGLERLLCPRVHFKSVIIDGKTAYSGSANLTGAGIGAKADTRRNFEAGIYTDEKSLVKSIMEQFDMVWMGEKCGNCGRQKYCPDYQYMKEELGG